MRYIVILVFLFTSGCLLKTKYYIGKKEAFTPIYMVEPFVLLRYLDEDQEFKIDNFDLLQIDSALCMTISSDYIYPALRNEVYGQLSYSQVILNSQEHNYLKMLIASDLVDKIGSDRFKFLIQNHNSAFLDKNDDFKFLELNEEKVLFVFVGGVYDKYPDNTELAQIRRFEATYMREESGSTHTDKDLLPFINICTGVFNLKSKKIEFLRFRESRFEIKKDSVYSAYVFHKLFKKMPPLEVN